MIATSYQQFSIVQGDTAEELTEKLNAKLFDLRTKQPVEKPVTFEGLIARISYTEKTTAPENLAEEYALQGVKLTCQDCPHFTARLKADGSEDLRAKVGSCQFASYGRTYRDARACEYLFNGLRNGEVKLCLAE